ncbi:GlxA family transcriptional regulator [Zavarzinia compransoris]|uniref:AraC family transcriptional regulator n=1 Tax=Zavarzinia compransoris TaxID=1264899 RepID=A0A317E0Y8_9PROT|nr:DJ-1/PfpI family protein [Zavarzinia compransoris]PWR18815.1 AraC family transcriptional regulator [Zavarzinia compransoris]TDP48802.1 transcriptional regulator GlxA family with amidase domain [Zavarzinia compransoris]
MARAVCFLVYPDFVLFDLSGPLEAFTLARGLSGGEYRLRVASLAGGLVRSSAGLEVLTEPLGEEAIDTLLVPGAPAPLDDRGAVALAAAVAAAAARVRRCASVCTGAFILGAAGLLDGRQATTHWLGAPQLQALCPAARIEGDRIFVRDGAVWTSAGMSAGIDLALALIEDDLGAEVACNVARLMVVYHRRPGGQNQFSSLLDLDPGADRIRKVLSFARDNLAADLGVERLAAIAGLSARQFSRAFTGACGMTPARAVERLRVEAARPPVEDGRKSFDEIAREAGFGDPERMCQGFLRVLGQTPQEARRRARAQTLSR